MNFTGWHQDVCNFFQCFNSVDWVTGWASDDTNFYVTSPHIWNSLLSCLLQNISSYKHYCLRVR